MRLIATGLLVAMAATFFVARAFQDAHPAWGYIQAFAEAAMVGGLADWFAVTALFRRPLGLPIPHTAIVPRNKDRIGDTLAAFLKDNFLIPGVVARRMRDVDAAGAVGRWLTDRDGRTLGGRLRRGAARLAVDLLQSLDQERLGHMVRGALSGQLRQLDIAPLLGQLLDAAIRDGRHQPLLDGVIRWAARVLEANDDVIRAMVHERAGSILRWTGLDETLANKIIAGLERLVHDMADDPGHPLRAKAEEGLEKLASDLQFDAEMQAKVARLKAELLDNPALGRWWQGVWETMRAALLRVARDPDALAAGQLGGAMRQLGETLQSDRALARMVNRLVRRAMVGAAADYGDGIVRLVSDTVRGWDARTITTRLEHAVGRDLQYIRVNGTLVGGCVGIVIHAADLWL
ncbi:MULTISPECIES: DUF445 domain-containing protein [unclassified Sphingomonas]|uniref:DUF445 domain-containing protein n=1 Tax=unclassified Sphingomonas TaxID=196159 RepID=UPI00082B34C3|nr:MULTISPECIES: DUF445 domain-containing protein [unclassified Sphingomonas]MCH4893881.1 DUF445 family protein [Sphingomonas sp. SFZ2018-12]